MGNSEAQLALRPPHQRDRSRRSFGLAQGGSCSKRRCKSAQAFSLSFMGSNYFASTAMFWGFAIAYGEPGASFAAVVVTVNTINFPADVLIA